MVPLYGEYFGLTSQPFSVSPDPKFLYPSPSHREGLAQLTYGIKARRGFVVLTGEVGTGKTTLIHSLLHQLHDDHTHFAFIFMMVTSMRDLLRAVCEDLGLLQISDAQREMHDYLALLNQFLLECYRKGDNVALVIDESQNLSPEVLEGVRLLSNFETSEDKVLQIILVGQPELAARLNRPELRQLKQRIALRFHLNPLTLDEVKEYIAKRLEIAGGQRSIFPAKTVEVVHAYSGGIPRLVNILCDNGMLTAYALGKKSVEVGMIEETARDLNLTVSTIKRVPVETDITSIKLWESAPAAAPEKSPKTADASEPARPLHAETPPETAQHEPIFKPEVKPAPIAQPEPPPAAVVDVPEPPPVVDAKPEPFFKSEEKPVASPQPEPPPIGEPLSTNAEPVLPEAQPERELKPEPPPVAVEVEPPAAEAEPVFKAEELPKSASDPEPPVATPKAAPIFNPEERRREPAFVRPDPVTKSPVIEEPKSPPASYPAPPPSFIGRTFEAKVETVPPKSFSRMISALTEAMGPMAPLVVREHVDAMGESLQAFPMQKLRRLVDAASREILSDSMKKDFMTVMSEEIRALHQGNPER